MCAGQVSRKASAVLLHVALAPSFSSPATVMMAVRNLAEILVRGLIPDYCPPCPLSLSPFPHSIPSYSPPSLHFYLSGCKATRINGSISCDFISIYIIRNLSITRLPCLGKKMKILQRMIWVLFHFRWRLQRIISNSMTDNYLQPWISLCIGNTHRYRQWHQLSLFLT